jgi:two-component system nitrate/nitrite response regulator NarL
MFPAAHNPAAHNRAPHNRAPGIRVFIAERNRMAGQLLVESLERDSRFQVIALSTIAELLSIATTCKSDVAIISADFVSAPRKGLEVARAFNARHPSVRIVILLDDPARESVIASFHSGARAVFCRTQSLSEFRTCVESVSRGEIWARSLETDYLLEAVRSSPSCDIIASGKVSLLSRRELEVAECAVQGQTNKQIASHLQLSDHTVKNYLFRIFEKLGVSNRIELLFLLSAHSKDAAYPAAASNTVGPTNSLDMYLQAAGDGQVSAQFIVGLAYFEGSGIQKNEQLAYYWLRMAEENSSRLREHSRMLIQKLGAKMKLEDVEALEKSLMAGKDTILASKGVADPLVQKGIKLAG